MSFKTIFQDTTAEDKVIKYLERKFSAIEARLSSIEKLLSAESKPQEPEWRPMSEAPRDKRGIKVKLTTGYERAVDADRLEKNNKGNLLAVFSNGRLWIVDNYYLIREDDLLGWRPL